MILPSNPPKRRGLLYGLALCVALALVGFGVMAKSWRGPERPVLAAGLKESFPSRSQRPAFPEPIDPPTGKALINPTYPNAPAPGSAYIRTLTFAELDGVETSSPGTRAARDLLVRTNQGDAAAAEALYSGAINRGFDEYQRAVFLNTVANIHKREPRLLENTSFVRFYGGKKKHTLEYGIVLSGVTIQKLADARMGPAGLLGLLGHRSPKSEKIASLEATLILEGPNIYAFDIDLYNPKSEPEKHQAETNFNESKPATTHPADVARALKLMGIISGVITK